MRIIVMSDTHGNESIVRKLVSLHSDASLFIHLGDGVKDLENVMRDFEGKEYRCVKGNCDIFGGYERLQIMKIEGKRMLITHGDMFSVKLSLRDLYEAALREKVDIACFGHTHVPHKEYIDGLHVFNPGSLLYGSVAGLSGAYGIIDIVDGGIVTINCNL